MFLSFEVRPTRTKCLARFQRDATSLTDIHEVFANWTVVACLAHLWHYGRDTLNSVRNVANMADAVMGQGQGMFRRLLRLYHPAWNILVPMDGFSWNLIFENYPKVCRQNYFYQNRTRIITTCSIKIYVRLGYLTEFFLQWEIFLKKALEKIKSHFYV